MYELRTFLSGLVVSDSLGIIFPTELVRFFYYGYYYFKRKPRISHKHRALAA